MNQEKYLSRNQICKQFRIGLLAFKKYVELGMIKPTKKFLTSDRYLYSRSDVNKLLMQIEVEREHYCTLKEAADLIGVSSEYLRKLIDEKLLFPKEPKFPIGKRYGYYKKSDVEALRDNLYLKEKE